MAAQNGSFRRPMRRLNVVRAFAVLALVAVALSVLVSGDRLGVASAGTPGEVTQDYAMSARHWNVPASVLMAIGYVESHWEQRGGSPSIDNGYGIMHITDRADGTLARAIALTGLSS